MSDRLRNEKGQYSTADETSDPEKEILNPEITGQTLAQHSEKERASQSGEHSTAQRERVSLSGDHRSNEFAVHRDSRHTDDGDCRHRTRVS